MAFALSIRYNEDNPFIGKVEINGAPISCTMVDIVCKAKEFPHATIYGVPIPADIKLPKSEVIMVNIEGRVYKLLDVTDA